MISKGGVELPLDKRKHPKFPVFKLGPGQVIKTNAEAPVFSPDTRWSVWKGGDGGRARRKNTVFKRSILSSAAA